MKKDIADLKKQNEKNGIEYSAVYVYQDLNEKDRVTVCLLASRNAVSRGVSVCSFKDEFNLKIGIKLAYRRAMRAIKNRPCKPFLKETLRGHDDSIRALMSTRCPFITTGEYCPTLSFYEQKILFGNGWKKISKRFRIENRKRFWYFYPQRK